MRQLKRGKHFLGDCLGPAVWQCSVHVVVVIVLRFLVNCKSLPVAAITEPVLPTDNNQIHVVEQGGLQLSEVQVREVRLGEGRCVAQWHSSELVNGDLADQTSDGQFLVESGG